MNRSPWLTHRHAALLLALLLLPLVHGCRSAAADPVGTQRLEVGGRTFHLELALDHASRYQGLSDRPSIPADGGMIFVFPRAQESCFVMRRTLVPLDLVFVGPNRRIVSMHRMAVEPAETPEWKLRRYCSQWPALAAIEFVGGTIDALGLAVGQELNLPLDELKSQAR